MSVTRACYNVETTITHDNLEWDREKYSYQTYKINKPDPVEPTPEEKPLSDFMSDNTEDY